METLATAAESLIMIGGYTIKVNDDIKGKGRAVDSKLKKEESTTITTGKSDKRVTRSQLDGHGINSNGNSTPNPEVTALYLPSNTKILLTKTSPPIDTLTFHPNVTPIDPTSNQDVVQMITQTPTYRTLDITIAFGRSRHVLDTAVDTSDAHYQRLHRYPEILEKRGARLELERLINERSKIILEIEELRARSYAYIPGQGGKGEIERNRKLKESEERLQRYDALLPNQPRKAHVLTSSRANSPPPRPNHARRNSTPLSISSDLSANKIRITFKGTANNATAGPSKLKLNVSRQEIPKPAHVYSDKYEYLSDTSSTDEEAEYLQTISSRRNPVHPRVVGTPRLPNSFFHSETLRASIMVDPKKSRRLSSRVADSFAFGHRVELRAPKPFQLVGGTGGDDKQEKSLEKLCEVREEGQQQPSMTAVGKRRVGSQYYVPLVVRLAKPPPWTTPTTYHSLLPRGDSSLVVALKSKPRKKRVKKVESERTEEETGGKAEQDVSKLLSK